MDTKVMQQEVMKTCHRHGWSLNPYKDLGLLTEEVGELAREVRRIEDGRERPDEVEPDTEIMKAHLIEEAGDILFPLFKLASYYGFTLEEAFQAHQAKMAERYEKENNEMFETEEK